MSPGIKELVLPHASTFPSDATHLPCRLRKLTLAAVHGLSLPVLRLVLLKSCDTLTTLSLPGLTQFFNSFSEAPFWLCSPRSHFPTSVPSSSKERQRVMSHLFYQLSRPSKYSRCTYPTRATSRPSARTSPPASKSSPSPDARRSRAHSSVKSHVLSRSRTWGPCVESSSPPSQRRRSRECPGSRCWTSANRGGY